MTRVNLFPLYTILLRLLHRARRVNPTKTVAMCAHPADDEFLACAIETPSDYLVTSNIRHFPVTSRHILNSAGHPVHLLLPMEFNLEVLKLQKQRVITKAPRSGRRRA